MKPRRLHHASICVTDVTRARAFWVDLLGLEVDPARPAFPFDGLWLNVGSGQIHLIQAPADADVGTRPAGLTPIAPHVALAVDDLAATRAELEAAGIEILGVAAASEQLWVRDPDGNVVELTSAD